MPDYHKTKNYQLKMTNKNQKIAYFVNQYPMVSHSFIRREIIALEKLGFEVKRYALRTNADELVDANDQSELDKTRFILTQSKLYIISTCLGMFFRNPFTFVKTLIKSIKIGWRSERGALRHLIYFAEACVLATWLIEDKVKHVHAHFGTNSTTVVLLAKSLGGPTYSFTVHGPEEFDKPEFIALGEKIKYASFVVAISSYCRSQLFRWCDYQSWSKVKIVHCGLDADFHQGDIPGVDDTVKLVCVGRLCEQKGQLLLVEAIASLVADGRKVQLVLAGDGPMRNEIEELIKNKDLTENIKITGWIDSDRVRQEIIHSRCLVLPSFAEGLPVVIMEAMALKRPVLSTYVAGIPELVVSGENGFLIPAGSVSAIKNSIEKLLAMSEDEINEFGKNARSRVLQRHDVMIEANKLAQHIHSVMN